MEARLAQIPAAAAPRNSVEISEEILNEVRSISRRLDGREEALLSDDNLILDSEADATAHFVRMTKMASEALNRVTAIRSRRSAVHLPSGITAA